MVDCTERTTNATKTTAVVTTTRRLILLRDELGFAEQLDVREELDRLITARS